MTWHDSRNYTWNQGNNGDWKDGAWVDTIDANGALSNVWSPNLLVDNSRDVELLEEVVWHPPDNSDQCDCPDAVNSSCSCGMDVDGCRCARNKPWNWFYSATVRGSVYVTDMSFDDFPFDSPAVTMTLTTKDLVSFVAKQPADGYSRIRWYLKNFPSDGNPPNSTEPVATGVWEINDVQLNTSGSDDTRVGITVQLRRLPNRILTRIVLPITLITGASLVVFWLGDDFSTRVGTSSTMMLALIAFLFLISSEVPNGTIPVATRLDRLVIAFFCIVFCVVVENIVVKIVRNTDSTRVSAPLVEKVRAKLLLHELLKEPALLKAAVEKAKEVLAKTPRTAAVAPAEASEGIEIEELGKQQGTPKTIESIVAEADTGALAIATVLGLRRRRTRAEAIRSFFLPDSREGWVDTISRILFPIAIAAVLIWFYGGQGLGK